ncbi:hypothetical protein ACVJF2_000971 [Bradyrhizobium sp. USDA 4519]
MTSNGSLQQAIGGRARAMGRHDMCVRGLHMTSCLDETSGLGRQCVGSANSYSVRGPAMAATAFAITASARSIAARNSSLFQISTEWRSSYDSSVVSCARETNLRSTATASESSLSTMRNKTDRNDARGIGRMMRSDWYRAVHVKNIDMQKMCTLLTSRRLLKRKLSDLENHIRGALRAYALLVGAIARGAFEARVRELIERTDPIFVMTIEAMLDVRRAILEGYDWLHCVLLQVVQRDDVWRGA